MKQIIPFSEIEGSITKNIKEELSSKNFTDELEYIEKNEIAIFDLAASISLYPSILGRQYLGHTERSVETLVENLCIQETEQLELSIPTKAILGKSFIIAKINFFLMVIYLLNEIQSEKHFIERTREIILNHLHGLMAEEVFISIISDKEIPLNIRGNAGYLLVELWEHRTDFGVDDFAPILNEIWSARKMIKPSYGTLFGISELFNFIEGSGPILMNFLTGVEMDEERLAALQEFLFGLSHEEIEILKKHMETDKIDSLSDKTIKEIISRELIYSDFKSTDPRNIFLFFGQRKRNADSRSRGKRKGPHKTIEEYLMCFLLAGQESKFSKQTGPTP